MLRNEKKNLYAWQNTFVKAFDETHIQWPQLLVWSLSVPGLTTRRTDTETHQRTPQPEKLKV